MEEKAEKKNFKNSRAWRKAKKVLTPLLFCGPYLLIFTVFVLTPFIMSIVLSFLYWKNFDGAPKFVLFGNYVGLFSDYQWSKDYWKALLHTLMYVGIATPILVIIPLLLAILLNQKLKGTSFYRAVIYFPCILSVTTAGIIWTFMLANQPIGLLNKLFGTNINWLTEQPYAWISIFLMSIWWGLGGNTTLFLAGLQTIPHDLYEAARMDGANKWNQTIHITLPGLIPTLSYVTIMTTIGSFNIMGQPMVLINGAAGGSTNVAVQMIYEMAFLYPQRPGRACAESVILGLIMLSFSVVALIILKKREAPTNE